MYVDLSLRFSLLCHPEWNRKKVSLMTSFGGAPAGLDPLSIFHKEPILNDLRVAQLDSLIPIRNG
jgi:hypothetical protein